MDSLPPELCCVLDQHGQSHLVAEWSDLTADERAELVRQIASLDLAHINTIRRTAAEPPVLPDPMEPAPITSGTYTSEEQARGEEALRRGEVAALLVAGGQATRLRTAEPKGMFPAGPLSGASLYQIHSHKVLAVSRRAGRPVPFLVMTSPATDAPTRAFFEQNRYFGLEPRQVRFFTQGTMPAVCPNTGRILLESRGRLFLSPNGHGGALTALAESGLLGELIATGVRHVFYFQVDNPLVKVCDPGFIGRHILTKSEASSKVVLKTDPAEKVGVLIATSGRCSIVEYTLLPRHLAEAREADGTLRYRAGSPAIHVFCLGFLERVTRTAATVLPYRAALKAVEHYCPTTRQTLPATDKPNALKFERFIFDALPHAERWLAVQASRAEEFAPIKNATGPDSPETARAAQLALHAEWLRRAGLDPNGYPVEVSPLFALDANDLAAKIAPGMRITGPTVL